MDARVLIAVPTFESIAPDTYKAIWDMDKPCECGWDFVRGYDCASARNNIVQKALDGGWTHVMMVDSDVTPPRDALSNLLSHGVECVSGFYLHRGHDNMPSDRTCACKLRDAKGKAYFNYPLESEYTVGELAEMRGRGEHLVEIHGGGMGCVLIVTDVFRAVKYPWFDWVNYKDTGRSMLSEDLYFCEELRKKGIPRHVDTRVACGHLFRKIEEAI